MWSVMEGYREKHYSFVTENELRVFLIDTLKYYIDSDLVDDEEIDYKKTTGDIEVFIKYFCDIADSKLPGWCVSSIHMLDFETQTITKYDSL